MAEPNMNSVMLNLILSSLYRKTSVPSDFHGRALAVKEMMDNDVSGLVQSLTDFQVGAANVNWYIRTGNETFDGIMKKWLNSVNMGFNGKIPSGINALAKEYFKERWQGASFPILKILEWDMIDGYNLPVKMAFVDGGNVYSGSENKTNEFIELGDQTYYLGSKEEKPFKLDKGCIITKPFGRWYDEYPKVYLVKNGVYKNWKTLSSFLSKQDEILDQVLPYLLLVQKGTERLAIDKSVNYDDGKLKQIADKFDEVISKLNDANINGSKKSKTPIRVTQFDEEIKHLIPDLGTILKQELSAGFEKRILAGMGFIDIADAVSTSRRESVLNPKAFIQETTTGMDDFGQVIFELISLIKRQNSDRIKYGNLETKVLHSKPQIFMDKEFRDFLLQLFNRGKLSQKTLVEVAGDQYYQEELEQRKVEARDGNEYFMYPPVVQNMEAQGNDYLGSKSKDPEADMKTTQEKLDSFAKEKYTKASILIDGLEGSPYQNIADLPKQVKDAVPLVKERRKWLGAFNGAYNYYLGKFGDKKKAETLAFKTAWSQVKKS